MTQPTEEEVTAGHLAFVIAAAQIERDVLLSELTADEERSLVSAVLSAAIAAMREGDEG